MAKQSIPGIRVVKGELPTCDFCPRPAQYDYKTVIGPWANACRECWETTRLYADLGIGKGQRLVLDDSREEG